MLTANWRRNFTLTRAADLRSFRFGRSPTDFFPGYIFFGQIFTGYIFADISPDKQFLALAKTQTRDDSDIYLYDLQSSEMTHLTPHEGNINHFPQGFSVDNARLSIREDRVSGIASA